MSNSIVRKKGHYQHQNGNSSPLSTVNGKCKDVSQEGRESVVPLLQNGGLEYGIVPEFFASASELAACEFCNKRVLIHILAVHSKQCPENPESEPKLPPNANKKNRKPGVRVNGQTKNAINNTIPSFQYNPTKKETDTLRGGAAVNPNNNVTRKWINKTERRKEPKLRNGTIKFKCETETKRKYSKDPEVKNGTTKSDCEIDSKRKTRKEPVVENGTVKLDYETESTRKIIKELEVENDTVKSSCETESKREIRKEQVENGTIESKCETEPKGKYSKQSEVENGTIESKCETEPKRKYSNEPKVENGTVKSDCETELKRKIEKEPEIENGTVKSDCESESEKKIRKEPEVENDTVKSGCETESKRKIRKELVVENGTIESKCETEPKRKYSKEPEVENGTAKLDCENEFKKKIRNEPEVEKDTVKSDCETVPKRSLCQISKKPELENGNVKSNYETESKRRKIDSQPILENDTVKSDCETVPKRSLCQISKKPEVENDEGKSAIEESNKITKIIPFDIPKRNPLKKEYIKAQKQELKVHRDESSPNFPDLIESLNKGVNILSGSQFSPTLKSSHSWDKPPIKESQTKSVPSCTVSKKDPFASIKAALRNRNNAEKLRSGLQTSGPGPPLFKRNNNKNESFKNSFIQKPIHSKAIQNRKNPLSYLIPTSRNPLRQEPSSITNNSPFLHNALKYTFLELPKSRKNSEKTGEENTGESSSNSERPPR